MKEATNILSDMKNLLTLGNSVRHLNYARYPLERVIHKIKLMMVSILFMFVLQSSKEAINTSTMRKQCSL